MDICELFDRMEHEIKTEISFPDKFLLAHYNESKEGLFFVSGKLCQDYDFFLEDTSDFLFVQAGDYVTFKKLSRNLPFWGIERSPRRVGTTNKFMHKIFYCKPILSP